MKYLTLTIGCLVLAGCNSTNFSATKPDGTVVSVRNIRFIWSTEAYSASITTNGATLTANKASTDNATISAIIQGAVTAAAGAAKP